MLGLRNLIRVPLFAGAAGLNASDLAKPLSRTAAIVGSWTLVALCWTPPTYWVERSDHLPGASPPGLSRVLVEMLCMFAPWMALTPLVLQVGARRPFVRGKLATAAAAHLVLGCILVPLMVCAGRLLDDLLSAVSGAPLHLGVSLHAALITSFYCVPTYVALVAIGQVTRVTASRPKGGGAKAPGSAPAAFSGKVPIRERGRTDLIDLADVDFIDVAGHYLCFHVGPKVHLSRGALSEIEPRLDQTRFMRVHRSVIVQLDRITTISDRRNGDCVLHLRGGAEIPASRSYREGLERRLGLERWDATGHFASLD